MSYDYKKNQKSRNALNLRLNPNSILKSKEILKFDKTTNIKP